MAVARPMHAPAVARPADKPRTIRTIEATSVPKFRRCTFRRVDATTSSRALTMYDVQCMYPDRETALPLGDLATAHTVCANCTYPGIFRPDAD